MWPDWVSNPGPLTYESGALPTGLCGPAPKMKIVEFPNSKDPDEVAHYNLPHLDLHFMLSIT